MAGPKKPAHLKLLTGNPGRRPIQKEVEPTKLIPDPPEVLSEDGKAEWTRLSHELFCLGLLTVVDRAALAAYCNAYDRWCVCERAIAKLAKSDPQTGGLMIRTSNGNVIQNPLVGTARSAAIDMVTYAKEFGMTPQARTRLEVGPSAPESKFKGLLYGQAAKKA